VAQDVMEQDGIEGPRREWQVPTVREHEVRPRLPGRFATERERRAGSIRADRDVSPVGERTESPTVTAPDVEHA
jgi:hypothetical protein